MCYVVHVHVHYWIYNWLSVFGNSYSFVSISQTTKTSYIEYFVPSHNNGRVVWQLPVPWGTGKSLNKFTHADDYSCFISYTVLHVISWSSTINLQCSVPKVNRSENPNLDTTWTETEPVRVMKTVKKTRKHVFSGSLSIHVKTQHLCNWTRCSTKTTDCS